MVVLVLAATLAGVFYWSGYRHAPAGQPPLVSLNPGNVGEFERSFDEARTDARLVLLVSPT
jgi:hypothetical protein